MTFKHTEKEFDEQFPAMDNYLDGGVKKDIKSFLKQSFIKYLQSEVERCKARIAELKEYPLWNDFVRGQNEELEDQITHLQAQIKEIEGV